MTQQLSLFDLPAPPKKARRSRKTKPVAHSPYRPINCPFIPGGRVYTPEGEATVYWVLEGVSGIQVYVQFDQQWPLVEYAVNEISTIEEK